MFFETRGSSLLSIFSRKPGEQGSSGVVDRLENTKGPSFSVFYAQKHFLTAQAVSSEWD